MQGKNKLFSYREQLLWTVYIFACNVLSISVFILLHAVKCNLIIGGDKRFFAFLAIFIK